MSILIKIDACFGIKKKTAENDVARMPIKCICEWPNSYDSKFQIPNLTRHFMVYLKSGKVYRMDSDHLSHVPNKAGIYKIYNSQKKPVYVGMTQGHLGKVWSKDTGGRYVYGLRHRLQSYKEKDDFSTHPTKKELRPHTNYFAYWVITDREKRRMTEKTWKQGMRFNHL